jgi:hypothetical protein
VKVALCPGSLNSITAGLLLDRITYALRLFGFSGTNYIPPGTVTVSRMCVTIALTARFSASCLTNRRLLPRVLRLLRCVRRHQSRRFPTVRRGRAVVVTVAIAAPRTIIKNFGVLFVFGWTWDVLALGNAVLPLVALPLSRFIRSTEVKIKIVASFIIALGLH